MPTLMILILLLVTPYAASADIYRYVDEEGVECFTDSPSTVKASLFLKEPRQARSPSIKARPAKKTPPWGDSNSTGDVHVTVNTVDYPSTGFPFKGRITSPVGLRHDPIDGTLRNHQGVDIAAPEGSPVRPVAPGTIVYSGYRQGYGKTVIVEHVDGMQTLYAHNSVNLVLERDVVTATTVIALSGSTGRSTGPHIHFEAWQGVSNITAALIDKHYGFGSGGSSAALAFDGIRRSQQDDGTLIFSNLPISRQ